MTALMTIAPQRRPMSTSRTRPASRRKPVNPLDLVVITTSVLRPILVTVAVLVASVASTSRAHADPGDDEIGPMLNSVGIDNNGPTNGEIADMGQSLCPMLVQPGSDVVGSASQISGNGGLAPPVAGLLAGMAIRAGCPGFMTSVADGNPPFPLSGAVPGAEAPVPLQGMAP